MAEFEEKLESITLALAMQQKEKERQDNCVLTIGPHSEKRSLATVHSLIKVDYAIQFSISYIHNRLLDQ
jgi:hypothetical protein